MSGHSKWATTKHKKAANDAKRSNLFAKLIKNIEVSARVGGPDPDSNPTLFDAIVKAKKNSVPNDNIDRALKRAAGAEGGGADYQSVMYEGYGPNGVAFLIECLTDNKNRASSDVRVGLTRNGGSLADPGSVSYMFSRKGSIIVPANDSVTEDAILEAIIDFDIEDIVKIDDIFEITTQATDLVSVRKALQEAKIDYDSADVAFVPSVTVEVNKDELLKITKIIDALEDSDDVQNVYSNFDAPDNVIAEISAIS